MTLADEDNNSILTDNTVGQFNVAVQVMQPGDQYKLCHLVARFPTENLDVAPPNFNIILC